MISNQIIRDNLVILYPQMMSICITKLSELKEIIPDTTLTANDILDQFINEAKNHHDEEKWGIYYQEGVRLLACHLLVTSQDKASNSGVVTRQRTGSSENGSETEFLRPSLKNFGKYSTTKYGMQWEALKEKIDTEYGDIAVFLV